MMIESLHMGHVELISVGFSEKKVVAHLSSGQGSFTLIPF